MTSLHEQLPVFLVPLSAELMRHLQRQFPRVCVSLREDAVQEALLHLAHEARSPTSLTQRAWARDGLPGVRRLAVVVAWRAVRGRTRRRGGAWCPLDDTLVGGAQPDELLIAKRAAGRLDTILKEAGPRFAPRSSAQLNAALLESLDNGERDAVVSSRHGVRREPLCRARRWVREQLVA